MVISRVNKAERNLRVQETDSSVLNASVSVQIRKKHPSMSLNSFVTSINTVIKMIHVKPTDVNIGNVYSFLMLLARVSVDLRSTELIKKCFDFYLTQSIQMWQHFRLVNCRTLGITLRFLLQMNTEE